VKGTIAPLLGLGAGFHPELTGRENVYLYGSLLGYTRDELNELYEDIVEFADLAQFIDSPLRTYSGGMSLRLGFSVATAKPADILLVDEVLAVGDAEFQRKCIRRMEEFREAGTSIVYVSHDLGVVENICDRVALLDHGRIRLDGQPDKVIAEYLEGVSAQVE
jgi:ABC-2 type transport system ATP-binding protein